MIRALLPILLFAPQDPEILRPDPPKVERSGPQWKIGLSAAADLPDETVVQVRLLPVLLRFYEDQASLRWSEMESGQPVRRSVVQQKKLALRAQLPGLRRLVVVWSLDPKAQPQGVTLDRGFAPVRSSYLLGSLSDRLKPFRSSLDEPPRLYSRLLELLKQMDEIDRSGSDRGIPAWSSSLASFRHRCDEEISSGPFTASIGLLDSVAGDAATYVSWLKSRRVAEKKPSNSGGSDSENAQNDNPTGDQPPTGGTSGPTAHGRKDNRDIRSDTAANLRKRLDPFAKLRRAEMLLTLAAEALELLEAGKAAPAGPLLDAASLVEGRLKDEKEPLKPLRDALATLASGDPAMRKSATDSLKLWEATTAKLAP